jgi:hypothetical protein
VPVMSGGLVGEVSLESPEDSEEGKVEGSGGEEESGRRSPPKRTLTQGRCGFVVSRHLAGCGLRAVKYSYCFFFFFALCFPASCR